MPLSLTGLVLVAMVTLLFLRCFRLRREGAWARFALEATALAGFAGFLHLLFGFPIPRLEDTAKGAPSEDMELVVVLFICMLAGMLAQVFYEHFSLPRTIRIGEYIDWGQFWAPACASPIVFIPLMVTLQNANLDLKALTTPRMMIFFVAFQNGFFWKDFFSRKLKEVRNK